MIRIDVIKTDTARVARISLAPGEVSPAHYHSQVTEMVVCLSGEIAVKVDSDEGSSELKPGEFCEIKPGERHYLVNLSPTVSEYLLVQEGVHDFVTDGS